MEELRFCGILDRFGISRASFHRVRKELKKRLVRRMQETGCRNIGD
jgi:hypothetical protein